MNLINDFDCDGYRPIHHAILANSLPRAQELVRIGALVNAPTESGDGALVLLCRALKDEDAVVWVEPLLSWGAEVIDRDRLGRTALHHACDRDLVRTASALLAGGADPFLKDMGGKRPVDLIASDSMRAAFSRLTRGP